MLRFAGIIRGEQIHIRCWSEEPLHHPRIVLTKDGGRDAIDLLSSEPHHGIDELLAATKMSRAGGVDESAFVGHYTADFEASEAYDSCRPLFDDAGGEQIRGQWLGPKVSLAKLLPKTREDCAELVSFKAKRHWDPETLRFIAAQTAENEIAPPAYRINALVVSLYKTIEADMTVDPAEIRGALERAYALLPLLQQSGSMKEDKDQLNISLSTAAWHVFAHCQDVSSFTSYLDRATKFEFKHVNRPSFAYNLTKSCLLKAFILSNQNDAAGAVKMARYTVDIFRFAAKMPAPHVTSFTELRVSLENAIAAWNLLNDVEAKDPIGDDKVDKILRLATRIEDADFIEKLRRISSARTAA